MPPTAVWCVVQIRGYLRQADDYGVSVAAVWIQDWVGTVSTSSGHRPFWDWRWNQQQYPGEIGTQVRRNGGDRFFWDWRWKHNSTQVRSVPRRGGMVETGPSGTGAGNTTVPR